VCSLFCCQLHPQPIHLPRSLLLRCCSIIAQLLQPLLHLLPLNVCNAQAGLQTDDLTAAAAAVLGILTLFATPMCTSS
jgi:hypothetical protein